ncbi:hypothetical protein [Desulfolithobacter sp.]
MTESIKKLTFLTSIVSLFLAISLTSALAANRQGKDEFYKYFALVLDLEYCWSGSSCGHADMYLTLDGNFTIPESGDNGIWMYNRADKSVEFIFNSGCMPSYWGQKTAPRTWSGTMACMDDSGDGTWTAVFKGIERTYYPTKELYSGSASEPPAN